MAGADPRPASTSGITPGRKRVAAVAAGPGAAVEAAALAVTAPPRALMPEAASTARRATTRNPFTRAMPPPQSAQHVQQPAGQNQAWPRSAQPVYAERAGGASYGPPL